MLTDALENGSRRAPALRTCEEGLPAQLPPLEDPRSRRSPLASNPDGACFFFFKKHLALYCQQTTPIEHLLNHFVCIWLINVTSKVMISRLDFFHVALTWIQKFKYIRASPEIVKYR